jgi:hypothetical protein
VGVVERSLDKSDRRGDVAANLATLVRCVFICLLLCHNLKKLNQNLDLELSEANGLSQQRAA